MNAKEWSVWLVKCAGGSTEKSGSEGKMRRLHFKVPRIPENFMGVKGIGCWMMLDTMTHGEGILLPFSPLRSDPRTGRLLEAYCQQPMYNKVTRCDFDRQSRLLAVGFSLGVLMLFETLGAEKKGGSTCIDAYGPVHGDDSSLEKAPGFSSSGSSSCAYCYLWKGS